MAIINREQEYQDQEAWSKDVEKLKGYKEFAENVEGWAEQTNIFRGSYEIVYDNELGWCVDVDGNVSFIKLNIEEIPFQFRNISGDFKILFCDDLISLKNCPVTVSENFTCAYCKKIKSFEGCPKEVGGYFDCSYCGKKISIKHIKSLCKVKGFVCNRWDGFN